MKNQFLLILSFVFSAFSFAQTNNIAEIYKDGVLNGTFVSKHPNGVIKAKGDYENNQKVGTWGVWDHEGNKVMVRKYGFNKEIATATFRDNVANMNEAEQRKILKFDGFGVIAFDHVEEEDVTYSKRLWRRLSDSELNRRLFNGNKLYDKMVELAQEDSIRLYSVADDQFTEVLDASNLSDFKGKTVVGYLVKEDWFFDKKRNRGDVRVIGFCPIIEIEGVEVRTFWVYYPAVRKELADLGADEIFYFHQFSSTILKESNVKDLYIADYKEDADIPAEVLRIESQLLETELDFWLRSALK